MQYQINPMIYQFYQLKKKIKLEFSMENKNTMLKTSSASDEQDAISVTFTDI